MISIIAAIAQNGAIGLNNTLLWRLPADLKRFKRITQGKALIMGRKTFESLPGVLPGRQHVVVTGGKAIEHENVVTERDLDAVLARYKNVEEEVFVIGGGMVYETALPYCQKLYLTFVQGDFEADTFFPVVDYRCYRLLERSGDMTDEGSGLIYRYEVYEAKDLALSDNRICEGR